jgi:hypothetical protein
MQTLVSGIGCDSDSALKEMELTKQMWRKIGGRQYDHYIQSFAPGEHITPAQAHCLAKEWAEHEFSGFECLIATHIDRNHIHSHIIVNSVSYETGRKIHTSAQWLQEAKNFSDYLCQQEEISICEKGKTFEGAVRTDMTSWSKDHYQLMEKAAAGNVKSFVLDIAVAIMQAKSVAISRADFIQQLLEQGITALWTNTKKYITFSDLEGNRVRNSKLEKTFHVDFSKEALEHEFRTNCQQEIAVTNADLAQLRAERASAGNQRKSSVGAITEAERTAACGIREYSTQGRIGGIQQELREVDDAIQSIAGRSRTEQTERQRGTEPDSRRTETDCGQADAEQSPVRGQYRHRSWEPGL